MTAVTTTPPLPHHTKMTAAHQAAQGHLATVVVAAVAPVDTLAAPILVDLGALDPLAVQLVAAVVVVVVMTITVVLLRLDLDPHQVLVVDIINRIIILMIIRVLLRRLVLLADLLPDILLVGRHLLMVAVPVVEDTRLPVADHKGRTPVMVVVVVVALEEDMDLLHTLEAVTHLDHPAVMPLLITIIHLPQEVEAEAVEVTDTARLTTAQVVVVEVEVAMEATTHQTPTQDRLLRLLIIPLVDQEVMIPLTKHLERTAHLLVMLEGLREVEAQGIILGALLHREKAAATDLTSDCLRFRYLRFYQRKIQLSCHQFFVSFASISSKKPSKGVQLKRILQKNQKESSIAVLIH
mmetsp:Transcript_15762/g.17551  ORF Transcript_15762/g.17551 Transcript_15762/m.17551 type:complete len:351 (-) Transcript_15762:438-1490(-)